jgi:hypothetical protein
MSALALKQQIGVSYNTAWSLKHKNMQTMKERDDCNRFLIAATNTPPIPGRLLKLGEAYG